MAIDLATLPPFVTRDEAAELLRLTTKSIDTMVSDGKLAKVKLGARRTGITRESMLAHLQRSGLIPTALEPTSQPTPGLAPSDYQSAVEVVQVEVPAGMDAEWFRVICVATDGWLHKQGMKGCLVFGNLDPPGLVVTWNKALGYSPKKVERAIKALDRKLSAVEVG